MAQRSGHGVISWASGSTVDRGRLGLFLIVNLHSAAPMRYRGVHDTDRSPRCRALRRAGVLITSGFLLALLGGGPARADVLPPLTDTVTSWVGNRVVWGVALAGSLIWLGLVVARRWAVRIAKPGKSPSSET